MPPSFEQYVTTRGPDLVRLAYVLCGDHHLAQDLVQEALAKAYRRWDSIESDNPEPYVRKAIVHAHLSWFRRRSNREMATSWLPERVAADFTTSYATRVELWSLLATLSKPQRAVLVLRFFEDLDDAQIAELLDCAQATVRVHAHRGLAKLRQRMSSVPGQPAPTLGAIR